MSQERSRIGAADGGLGQRIDLDQARAPLGDPLHPEIFCLRGIGLSAQSLAGLPGKGTFEVRDRHIIIMKHRHHLLALLVAFGMGVTIPATAASSPTPAHHALTDIVFLEPKNFTDVRDSHMGDHERTTYLDQLRDHLRDQARYYVPAGYRLAVTFKDIDMAGDFEPWHGPQYHDIRIVKDIYPPRIVLAFRMTDAEGNVVAQGERALRDLAFMMKITMGFRNDPMRHEKALLDDWLRNDFDRIPRR